MRCERCGEQTNTLYGSYIKNITGTLHSKTVFMCIDCLTGIIKYFEVTKK